MRNDFKKYFENNKEIHLIAILEFNYKHNGTYKQTWSNALNIESCEYTKEFHTFYDKKLYYRKMYKITGKVYRYKRKNGTIDYSIEIKNIVEIEV